MDTAAVLSNISSWEIPNRNEGFNGTIMGISMNIIYREVSSWENHRTKWGIVQQCLITGGFLSPCYLHSMKAWIPVLMCGNVCWRLGQSLIPFAHCRTFQPQNPIRWSSLATTGCSWAGFHHMTSGIGDGYPGIASPQLLPPLFSGFPVVCVVVVHVNLHQPPVTLSSAMQALRGAEESPVIACDWWLFKLSL